MDADRFDHLVRRLIMSGSRRIVLRAFVGTAIGGAFARLGIVESAAKRKRRKGKRKKHPTSAPTPPLNPVPPSPPPASPPGCSPPCEVCRTCQNGQCVVAAAGARCGSGMICVGTQCVTGQGTCATGANTCAPGGEFIACQGQDTHYECQCLLSAEGPTRCAFDLGLDIGGSCGSCASSDECAELNPGIPGVFCVQAPGTSGACCSPETRGFCVAPCPPKLPCSTPDDCPGSLEECEQFTCLGGKCGKAFVANGTPAESQTFGDCERIVCDGQGGTRSETDDTDLPLDDGNECTNGICDNGTPQHANLPVDMPCSGGTCDGNGNCVP